MKTVSYRALTARDMLDALLTGKGYRTATVSGPFTGRKGGEEYVVTILEWDDTETRTLRGTFAAIREVIEALPRCAPDRRKRPGSGRR